MAEFFHSRAQGITLFVRLTPGSAKDVLEGIGETADGNAHVKARVRAVPEKGAANSALEKLVAKTLGVPASSVNVAAGGASRLKTLHIAGDPVALAKAAAELKHHPDRKKPRQ